MSTDVQQKARVSKTGKPTPFGEVARRKVIGKPFEHLSVAPWEHYRLSNKAQSYPAIYL